MLEFAFALIQPQKGEANPINGALELDRTPLGHTEIEKERICLRETNVNLSHFIQISFVSAHPKASRKRQQK